MLPLEQLQQIPIYYIVGIGRSGTSLLTALFHPNPKVWASPENTFLLFFYQAYRHKKTWTAKDINAICDYFQLIFETHPHIGWQFDFDKMKQDLSQLPPHTDYANFCKAIYFNFSPSNCEKKQTDIQFILDKNPSYTLQWKHLLNIDPQHAPKFIVMLRDYRANILSRRQSINIRKPQTAFDAYRWLFFNQRAQALLQQKNQLALLLRYEDMITQPEEQTKRVCNFMQVSYTPNMLQFHERDKKVYETNAQGEVLRINRFQKKYGDLAKPINTDRLAAWKTELPLQDRLIAEYICGKMGKQFGYETTLTISTWQKITLFFTTLIPLCRAIYDVYKDDILLYVSPSLKMKRIRQLRHKHISNTP